MAVMIHMQARTIWKMRTPRILPQPAFPKGSKADQPQGRGLEESSNHTKAMIQVYPSTRSQRKTSLWEKSMQ